MLSLVQQYLVGILVLGSLGSSPQQAQAQLKLHELQKNYIATMQVYSNELEYIENLGIDSIEAHRRIEVLQHELKQYQADYCKAMYRLTTDIKEVISVK